MEKLKLTSEEYAAAQAEYRSRYHYEDMTEDEKIEFDKKLDAVMELKEDKTEKAEEKEAPEKSEKDQLRDALREKHEYDLMTDEEREKFDERFEKAYDDVSKGKNDNADSADQTDEPDDTGDSDDTDEPKVKKLVRTR